MPEPPSPLDHMLHDLGERAKELNCLYEVQELLGTPGISVEDICQGIVKILPPGWQYPDVCEAEILQDGNVFRTPGFTESPWVQSAEIVIQQEVVGSISVCYTEERPPSDEGPFLKEERRLLNTIAEQLGFYLLHQDLRRVFQEQRWGDEERKSEWMVILDLLKQTDPGLLTRISRKMINFLGWNGIKEAEQLLERFILARPGERDFDENRPNPNHVADSMLEICDQVFDIAGKRLSKEVILENIQKWVKEDRVGFLVSALGDPNSSLTDVGLALERYSLLAEQGIELTAAREKWLRATLIRRILSDQRDFLRVAQRHIGISEFGDIMNRVIYPPNSHGRLGGKGAGLLLASQIILSAVSSDSLLSNVKIPKTWYLTSDNLFYFMSYNGLEDTIEQKYKELGQVRLEYPYIMHLFKRSPLPPETVKGLSLALDDFGDVPLIVRSSSLLEDRGEASFAGKYKSLFIANKGTKEERLSDLMDAVSEVLASTFGPDPIEYRTQRGLVDQQEGMGIMIQQVVGAPVGQYYLPAFAGVAFSRNQFRWSSRLKAEDGLVRLVPGLGTRAVDRLIDDYPILVAPGQPHLRVNITAEEVLRYSPKRVDVINLATRKFETMEVAALLREHGGEYPIVNQLVSLQASDGIRPPGRLAVNFEKAPPLITFDGLLGRTPFLRQVRAILDLLQEQLGYPVDIEFAHDGTDFYLLQCREQSRMREDTPVVIPEAASADKVIFTANRFVPNGRVSGITHIVYVDPQKYGELEDYQDLADVGRAIGELNKALPSRKFILMGPGRWGSRGDIKLGVSVTYADIDNTCMLIEIARKQQGYVPEPSFGTHFFQDLVEASIYYLPLYPDDSGVIFNESILTSQSNVLTQIVPGFEHLGHVLRVIDIPASTGGGTVQVLMNQDQEHAIALIRDSPGQR